MFSSKGCQLIATAGCAASDAKTVGILLAPTRVDHSAALPRRYNKEFSAITQRQAVGLSGQVLRGQKQERYTGMATTDVVPQESSGQLGQKRVVNDMSIQVATVNGSGSQSSNTVLLRSIFQMGVPISGKNLFPSNIAGLADVVYDPRQ